MKRIQDPWRAEGTTQNDAAEAHAAAQYDNADYVSVGGQWHDADAVPDLADVADLGSDR